MDPQGAGGEAERLKEVLRLPVPGKGDRVDADAALLGAPALHEPQQRLTASHTAGVGGDVDVSDLAEDAAIVQFNEINPCVTDGRAVDADDREQSCIHRFAQAGIQGFSTGFALGPDRAAASRTQLINRFSAQPGDFPQISHPSRACVDFHGHSLKELLAASSCLIRLVTVWRFRWVFS